MVQRSSIGRGKATVQVDLRELELQEQDHLRDADGGDEQQQPRLVEQAAHHQQLGEPAEDRADEDRERHRHPERHAVR